MTNIPTTLTTETPFLLYGDDADAVRVRVLLRDETIWLSQRSMAELFQSTTDNISLHLKNIYAEGELNEQATTEDFSVVQTEGERDVRRTLKHYNLDTIIAVGYRVKERADAKAIAEYKIFNKTQNIESDFDKVVKKVRQRGKSAKTEAQP